MIIVHITRVGRGRAHVVATAVDYRQRPSAHYVLDDFHMPVADCYTAWDALARATAKMAFHIDPHTTVGLEEPDELVQD